MFTYSELSSQILSAFSVDVAVLILFKLRIGFMVAAVALVFLYYSAS